MSKNKSEEYVREISCWLSMSGRDQSLLVDRINRHMSYARLSKKYGISPHRIRRIVLKFWQRIATRLFAFDRQFGNREAELIGELIEIKLHNPSTVGDFIKATCGVKGAGWTYLLAPSANAIASSSDIALPFFYLAKLSLVLRQLSLKMLL